MTQHMSHVFLIGATGGVGHRLAPLLVKAGHKVSGLHRKPEQAEELKAQGVTPVHGDLMEMDADAMTEATQGADIVVFSAGAAGSGKERTSEIDGQGPVKLIEAARRNGIDRIYLVSVIPDAGRDQEPDPGFEHYMKVKKQADIALTQSGLNWVILRPGTLQHEDADNQVNLGPVVEYGDVKRGNVAKVLAELIETPEISQEILELTDGSTSIARAVAGVA